MPVEDEGKFGKRRTAKLRQKAFSALSLALLMRGKIEVVAGALVLGEDNPVTGEPPGPRALDVPICELVGEDARPNVRILAVFVGNTRDHLVQVSIALAARDAPSLAHVSHHVARGEEMLMP